MLRKTHFSPVQSRNRLRLLQQVCDADVKETEGLLIVPGIDGKFNVVSARVVNFLLAGASGRELFLDPNISDDNIEDTMYLITRSGVRLFCNPDAWKSKNGLLQYYARWRHASLWKTSDDAFTDAELAEDYKVHSFVKMLKHIKRLRAPLSAGPGTDQERASREIEKWPIVQSYAIEGAGSEGAAARGFLTMALPVRDATPALEAVFAALDAPALEAALRRHLPPFLRAWEAAVRQLDSEEPAARAAMSEAQLGEPLLAHFAYALGPDADPDAARHGGPWPRVVAGARTEDEEARTSEAPLAPEAVHVVMEACEADGPLRCSRTFFLRAGQLAQPHPAALHAPDAEKLVEDEEDEALEAGRAGYRSDDLAMMLGLYAALVAASRAVVRSYRGPGDPAPDALRSVALAAFDEHARGAAAAGAFRLPDWGEPWTAGARLRLALESRDALGRRVPEAAGRAAGGALLRHARVVRLALHGLASLEAPGRPLGALVTADTFVEASGAGEAPLVLTEHVPRTALWPAPGPEALAARTARRAIEGAARAARCPLGRHLRAAEGVELVLPGTLGAAPARGTLHAFEEGLAFHSARGGAVALSFAEHVAAVRVCEPSEEAHALLVLDCRPALLPHGPASPALLAPRPDGAFSFALALSPALPQRRFLLRDALVAWRRVWHAAGVRSETGAEVPPAYARAYAGVAQGGAPLREAAIEPYLRARELADAFAPLGRVPPPLPSEPTPDRGRIPVTIITGIPGSGKTTLAQLLVKLASGESRWVTAQIALDEGIDFDERAFEERLLRVAASAAISRNDARPFRVLYVTNGYTEVETICRTLHRTPSLAERFCIAAVTCCVNVAGMYRRSGRLMPRLLEQCTEGFVQNIVLTHCESASDADVREAQALLKACNPAAVVQRVRTVGGRVAFLPPDVAPLLATASFGEAANAARRLLAVPDWDGPMYAPGPPDPHLSCVYVAFRPPLDLELLRPALERYCRGPDADAAAPPDGVADGAAAGSGRPGRGQTEVFRLKALVRGRDNTAYEIDGGGRQQLRVAPAGRGSAAAVVMTTRGREEPASRVFVIGRHVDRAAVVSLLMRARPAPPAWRPLRSRESVTPAEMEAIRAAHLGDPLPPDCYFTGSAYVGFDGSSSPYHPDMEKFVAGFLAQENEAVMRGNEAARRANEAAEHERAQAVIDPSEIAPDWCERGEARGAAPHSELRPHAAPPTSLSPIADGDDG